MIKSASRPPKDLTQYINGATHSKNNAPTVTMAGRWIAADSCAVLTIVDV